MSKEAVAVWRMCKIGLFCLVFLLASASSFSEPSQPQPHSLVEPGAQGEAVARPVLRWTPVADAVHYELELWTQPPEEAGPEEGPFLRTRQVFQAAYHADFSVLDEGQTFYWRVRALDLEGQAISRFSPGQRLEVDPRHQEPLRPQLNADFNADGMASLLYPVYTWVMIPGAAGYEVELLSAPPEEELGVAPSQHRIWSQRVGAVIDCYDEQPRSTPGVYYWRVRGLDEHGGPVGVWSEAGRFLVDPAGDGWYSASFGDSIVHGGGSVSFSPADREYDFQYYLHFPHVNLGRSGDTSETMLERFDRDVLPYQPKYLLILGGTNSLRGGVSAEQVIGELEAIGEKCRANGIRPIFLTLPSINPGAIEHVFEEGTAENWRAAFSKVNQFLRRQPYCIDLEPHFIDADGVLQGKMAVDGLHPGLEGKRLMAQIIERHWVRVTR